LTAVEIYTGVQFGEQEKNDRGRKYAVENV